MDVSSPIGAVVPTLDGPVLEVLAGTTAPLSLSQVAALAGRGSLSGVRLCLVRLVTTGLVRLVPGGYILNRDHVAADAVIHLASLRTVLAERLRRDVSTWAVQPELLGFFGSYARRDGDDSSDIDVLVVSASELDAECLDALTDRLQAWTGNNAQIVSITREHLWMMQQSGEAIVSEWKRDFVTVVGDEAVFRGSADQEPTRSHKRLRPIRS